MIPYLKKRNGKTILMVHDQPFIMLAGEVRNSSSSSMEYMEPIWEKLKRLHLNSVLLPVTWQMVEPKEGEFDFSLIDGLLKQAREHEMKIGFLWFGTWKNAQCFYAPEWVKKNKQRFFRAEMEKGKPFLYIEDLWNMPYSTLSAFSEETMQADARAFQRLMDHLREVDEEENTVIMVQVENETGFLGASREHSDLADARFAEQVPRGLIEYLLEHQDTLAADIREMIKLHRTGDWKTVFGSAAEEIFSAYYVASFVETVAKAGKKAYPLPMSVNCWLEQKPEAKPGEYPSGGPVARMMEIWKYAAPSIDIFAPDIYLPAFYEICQRFTKLENPLFIPEAAGHSLAAVRQLYVIGHFHAICYSPFAIEELGGTQNYEMGEQMGIDTNDPALKFSQDIPQYSRLNELLSQMMPVIAEKYGTAALQAAARENRDNEVLAFGDYGFHVTYRHPMIKCREGACLIAQLAENEFLVLGCGCHVIPFSLDDAHPYLEFLSLEEGSMKDGVWKMLRKLNGDEERICFCQPAALRVKLNLWK